MYAANGTIFIETPDSYEPLCLTLSNGSPSSSTTLPRVQSQFLTMNSGGRFLHNFLTFSQDHLDVAGIRHVRIDLTKSVNITTISHKSEFRLHLLYRAHDRYASFAWELG